MTDILQMLDHIDPALLDYQEWCNVGMALKHEGHTFGDWDRWSQRDTRYKDGDCERKWRSFNGSTTPVTGGTLYEMATRQGWRPDRQDRGPGRALDWDTVIGGGSLRVLDPAWVQDAEVCTPDASTWRPAQDLIAYLEALFQAEEYVGYVCDSMFDGERWKPKSAGVCTRTAGELLAELRRYNEIGKALGDYDLVGGAWIRFNPLDGKGAKDGNVAAFRYALIESDTVSIEQQRAIYDQLELPIAAMVHSGKKSLHAIVRIDAATLAEYRDRVNFLHTVCAKNGLPVDTQNRNPSRLSRMPGATRDGQPQFLVATAQGKASWEDWKTWIEELNDSLPDIQALDGVWDNPPALSRPLIDGLLRQRHKMLVQGPSKAGKSFLLLQLAMAIAEGRDWLGWPCTQGAVLYVNLEIDDPSCIRRIQDLYTAKGWGRPNDENFDLWNLRGRSAPLDVLAPKLIRRAKAKLKGYSAIIIDPIYKVSTGDENDAHAVAMFCNQLDRIALETGAAVIYCHHHSKGSQGQKSAKDRSSGSGVFARDADAILDLIELNIETPLRQSLENTAICAAISAVLNAHAKDWQDEISQDDTVVANRFEPAARKLLPDVAILDGAIAQAKATAANVSGWRMEGDLREFAPLKPRRLFYSYPVHRADSDDILTEAKAAGEEAPWVAQAREAKAQGQQRRQTQREELMTAFQIAQGFDGDPVLIGDLADSMGKTPAALKRILGQTKALVLGDDHVVRTPGAHLEHTLETAILAARGTDGGAPLDDVAKAMKVSEMTVRRKLKQFTERWENRNGFIYEVTP